MRHGKLFSAMDLLCFFFQRAFCKAYFDDLFVFTPSDSMEEHLAALEKVLERCKEEQLYIKLSKCTFCASEIPCLGDFIGADGIRMDPDKISIIKKLPTPEDEARAPVVPGHVRVCAEILSRICGAHGATD
ncbi:hypothetical protein PF003_g3075 [Phytophthora fragariae]|nr:hypothetical protein PF003_g3075 [Phytophthora fragariae]